MDTPLELVDLDDLLNEVKSRFDGIVFMGVKELDLPSQVGPRRETERVVVFGGRSRVLGIIVLLQDMLLKGQQDALFFDEAPGPADDDEKAAQ